MNVYFVVLNEMLTGVVASQVITPAKVYAAALPDLSVRIAFLEPTRVALSRRARKRLHELRHLWPEGRMSLCPYIGRLGRFSAALSLQAFVSAIDRRDGQLILHCRGPEATIQAAHVAEHIGGQVVFDSRGTSGHEAILRLTAQGRGDDADLLQRAFEQGARIDQLAAEKADAIVAVGELLSQRLRQTMNGKQKPMMVIPCCIEQPLFSSSARQNMRSRLGIAGDELLLAHISTEARWEDFNQVMAFFRAVCSRRRSRMLFLTTLDPLVVMRSLAANDPLRRALIIRKSQSVEMPQYLSAADVGLLFRPPNEAFRVGNPIKFAEYLGAGLAVAVSEGIGTTADVVESKRIGVGVPVLSDTSGLEDAAARLIVLLDGDRDALRHRSIQTCEELYVWERYVPVISQLYGLS